MMSRALLLFVFFLIGLTLRAQVPGFFLLGDQKKAKLPFLASNSLILLPVSINGNPPCYFLVDTGVRANLLFSKTMGDSMGLSYSRRVGMVGADGSTTVWAQVSPMNTLGLGEVEGRLQSLLVLEEDFLELESVIGIPVYGILGYEFFKYNAVKIDYEQSVMTFYAPEGLALKSPFYRKGTLTLEEGKAYLEVKVRQQSGPKLRGKVLVDTGANHGLLLNRETLPEIQLPEKHLETQLGQSLGGVLYGSIGRVAGLSIRGLQFTQVLTSFPEESFASARIKESGRIGSLGAEVLGRMTVILDYPRNEIFVRRSAAFYQPFEFDMSGLVVKKLLTPEKRWYVGDVREGSPANLAGILPFDEILTINSVPILLWEMDHLVKLLRAEEGKEIQLEVRRYSQPGSTSFEDFRFRFFLKKQI
jgi:predicted aspartyl protease